MYCSINDIAQIAGGRNMLSQPQRVIHTLLTDSRALSVNPGASLFFALQTEVGDGHNYLSQMHKAGVRSFVVSQLPAHPEEFPESDFIVVDSPWEVLGRLGAEARHRFQGTVVAVTGSQGKTTLKEHLFQALASLTDVYRSPRSFNSRLGVPLSLWRLPSSGGVAIIEAGISKPDEMAPLADIISPDIAVITNIGDEHSKNFLSTAQQAREKALLAKDAHTVICNDSSAELLELLQELKAQRENLRIFQWSYHNADAQLFISSVERDNNCVKVSFIHKGEEHHITVDKTMEYPGFIDNLASSIAVMICLGIDISLMQEGVKRMHPVATRLDVVQGVNDCKLIFDTFTPDFDSLETALDFLKRRADGFDVGRTLILGDLRGAKTESGNPYKELAALISRADINRLICIGPGLRAQKELFPSDTVFCETPAEFNDRFSTSDFSSEIILIKGASPEMGGILTNLEARTHETVLEVNLDAMVRNFNYFRSHLPSSTGLVAMVKASGYGAGSVEIAKTLQEHGAAYLAVAVLDEGIELRRAGITMPVMVLNPKVVNYKAMFAHNLEPEIYSFEMFDDVVREAAKCGMKNYPVHIKLDTGMHRMGFNEEELPLLAEKLRNSTEIVPASVFSHLATADCPDMDDYTELQLKRFEEFTQFLLQNCGHTFKRHILNSAGILRFPQYHYDYARLGIGLYGANTLPPSMEKPLDTVSRLRTVVIAVKEREETETIGYARKGRLHRKSRIATIPIGYADGMNRHFGNGNSHVWINGHRAPTIGNICMDACMIDVTDIPCRPGDVVEIFGPNISVQELADTLQTIPYEILTSISPRVKRIYYRE